jgi:hypothetical protein
VIGSKFDMDRQGVFSRRTLENQPFPLKASIAYKTLPCANALACDLNVFTACTVMQGKLL